MRFLHLFQLPRAAFLLVLLLVAPAPADEPVTAPAAAPAAPPAAAPAAAAPPRPLDPARVRRGQAVYGRYCVSCHGDEGDGRGYSAQWIDPLPRDFTRGLFKWRSTASGNLPTDDDLTRTLTSGLFHTNMPSWGVLGERNVRDVIEYLKTFSPRWKAETSGPPLSIPPEPQDDASSRSRGAEVWQQMSCASCHGSVGKGDGPSASALVDDWGHKIEPHDFTRGHSLKCGNRPVDLYRVFMTGLNGTPMPSFSDALSPQDAWALVHYVRTLAREQ